MVLEGRPITFMITVLFHNKSVRQINDFYLTYQGGEFIYPPF